MWPPLRTALRTATAIARPIHTSSLARMPYADSQDRESLKPGSTENTRSGRDGDVANDPDIAFNSNEPKPEDAAAHSAKKSGKGSDPLDASGANVEVNKPVKEDDSGTEVRKGGASKEKSPQKKGTLPRA